MRTALTVTSLLALLIIALVVVIRPVTPESSDETDRRDLRAEATAALSLRAPASDHSGATTPQGPTARHWQPGLTLTYDHQSEMALTLDGTEPDLKQPDASIEGLWVMVVESVAPEAITVQAHLAQAKVWPIDRVPQPELLALPCRLVLKPSGQLVSAACPRQMPALARQTLRSVAAATQVSLEDGPEWTLTEVHMSGTARAHYVRSEEILERTRTLIAPNTGFSDESALEITEARTRVRLHKTGHPESLEAVEALRLDESHIKLRTRQRVDARLLSVEQRPVPSALTGLVAEAIDATVEEDPLDHDRQEIVGVTVEQIVAEAGALDVTDKTDRQKAGHLLLKAESMVRVHPDAVEPMLEAIRADRGRMLLTSALGNSGTPVGRRALEGLLADEDPALRLEAAQAMAVMPEADAASVEALSAAAGDEDEEVAAASLLSMGSAARKAPDTGEADPFSQMMARLDAAQTDSERSLALNALGNLGDPRALSVMVQHIGHGAPMVASAAVWGLRFIPGGDVDALLETLIRAEGPLAADALAAAQLRDPARFGALIEAYAAR